MTKDVSPHSTMHSDEQALSIVRKTLNAKQIDVVNEALAKGSGCIKTWKGFGKTRVGLTIGLENGDRTIIVCTNSVAKTFLEEIPKVFGEKALYSIRDDELTPENTQPLLRYALLSGTSKLPNDWTIPSGPFILIATTPYISDRLYKPIDPGFTHVVNEKVIDGERKITYDTAKTPALPSHTSGASSIFSFVWDTLIVDEAQTYQNITSDAVLTICSIAATSRWALSASPIKNVSPKQYLAYYAMIGADVPRTTADLKRYMSHSTFGGLKETMIVREEADEDLSVELISRIVSHSITTEEAKIFAMFRRVLSRLVTEFSATQVNSHRYGRSGLPGGHTIEELNGSLLAAVDYLRQGVAFPMMPLVSVFMKMAYGQDRTPIVKLINEEIASLGLDQWFMNTDNALSSRMKSVLEVLKTIDKPCVIFAVYKRTAKMIAHYIKDRPVFLFTGDVPVDKQGTVIDRFRESKNGVLIMTYRKGSVSLNLQNASHVLLVDLEWSVVDGEQAVARLFRKGQTQNVHVYYFTSNTGIEAGVMRKQLMKRELTEQAFEGPVKSIYRSIAINKFVDELIAIEDNVRIMKELYMSFDDVNSDGDNKAVNYPPVE